MAAYTTDLNNEFSLPINFDVEFEELMKEDVEKVKALKGSHPFIDSRGFMIPLRIYEVVEACGLRIDQLKSFLFKLDPLDMGPIHLDGDPRLGKLRRAGLNFSWGNSDTYMQWFENHAPRATVQYNGITLPHFDPATTRMLYQKKLSGGNLVHLEYPHRVRSLSPVQRISLSVGFKEDLSWSELKERFVSHGYSVPSTVTA